jgi:hypothetical protein
MSEADRKLRAALDGIALHIADAVQVACGKRLAFALVVFGETIVHHVAVERDNAVDPEGATEVVISALADFVEAYRRGEHRVAGINRH